MAEFKKLETLVYCLGPVGGKDNNVITEGSAFSSKFDYTKKGYARYIKEANNVIKFHHRVINYFMDSVKSEFEEDPLAFVEAENEDDLLASIDKMKKQWKEMFKQHQKELREVLENPKEVQPIESSEESSSGSYVKLRRLDPEVISKAGEKNPSSSSSSSVKLRRLDPEVTSEAGEKNPQPEKGATPEEGAVGVPVDEVEFPECIFQKNLKEFHTAVKMEYRELRARMGKALERFSGKNSEVKDLKGFTFQKMGTFAKWKYALKTLGHLVPELERKFGELDLDFYEKKENEKRLTDWLFFDDGKRDRKYLHRLLITMELAGPIEEVSGLVCKQLRRWTNLTQSLAHYLPEEYEAFRQKAKEFQYEVLYNRPMKKILRPQKSTDSGDTLFNIDDMPEET